MTCPFTLVPGGFRVEPGTYAVVAQDWNGSIPDPTDGAGRYDELGVPGVYDAPAVVTASVAAGPVDALILPVGVDQARCPGRTIAIGDQCLVVFHRLALVPMQGARRRHNPYASHLEEVAVLTVRREGVVRIVDDGYDLEGFDRGASSIDAETPGAFSIEGEMFDMGHPAVAKAFGYGTPAFNASLDEHGFPCDVKALRAALADRRDPEGVALRNRLARKPDFAIAYWTPVQP